MSNRTRKLSHVQAEQSAAQRWRALLFTRVPLAGEWLRTRGLAALTEMVKSGSGPGAAVIAAAIDTHPEEAMRSAAKELLRTSRHNACWDAAWQVWADGRGTALGELLAQHNRPATQPPATQALSALFLQAEELLSQAEPELVDALIAARDDRDELLAARARFALARFKSPEAIQALCGWWVETRSVELGGTILQAGYLPERPAEARVLVGLFANRLEAVTQCGAEHVPALIEACNDADPEIRARARFCLVNLQSPGAISALCARWVRERNPLLEEAVVRARYVATRPAAVRVLTALKTGRQDIAGELPASSLEFLLAAVEDADREIGEQAGLALRKLTRDETRDALCRLVIDEDNAQDKEICLEAGYLPSKSDQRALFLFLTGQISAYETLDFDQGMLNAVYSSAPAELRQRILRGVQQAGRTDFLTILTGADVRARAAGLTPIETQLLVRVLANNQEWERLWQLAQEVALSSSVEILQMLTARSWRPSEPTQRELFDELAGLASQAMLTGGAELAAVLPVAVPRAQLRVHGRVNDLAFAPDTPLLAIASGARTLACWDYHKGQLIRTLRGFQHSLGQVVYTPNGTLLCAERTSGSAACGIYLIAEDQAVRLGQHLGSVTALEPVGDRQFITAGRDQIAALWNLETHHLEVERALSFWARAACVAPGQESVLLLHDRLTRLSLPELSPQPDLILRASRNNGHTTMKRTPVRGMTRAAAFVDGQDALLAGQYNGQVVLYENLCERTTARLVTTYADGIIGVRGLNGRKMAVVGSAGGDVRLISFPDGVVRGQLHISGQRLTSLHVSPDGAFLSTGSDDSTLTLWDLRVMDLPALFEHPVAAAHPDDIDLAKTLAEYDLPEAVHNALVYLQRLLQQRFRFDIHIDDAVSIQAGEFDVLID